MPEFTNLSVYDEHRATADVAGADPMEPSYTSGLIIPSHITVSYSRPDGKLWSMSHAKIWGQKIKNDGTPGKVTGTRSIHEARDLNDTHDWVREFVDQNKPSDH